MKKIALGIFALICFIKPWAQNSSTTSFDVDGIKVIFKPTIKETVSVRVYFKGGVTNYPENQAGIETLALSALTECGTKKYTADAFKDTSDKYLIKIGGTSSYDYGFVSMLSISKFFDKGWDLLTEAIMNPSFNESELNQLKTKSVSIIKSSEQDPDSYIDQMEMLFGFGGSPYATDPNGKEEIIEQFNQNSLKEYYKNILNKNQMFIVIAGNISIAEIRNKIEASFSSIPSKPYTPFKYNTPIWQKDDIRKEKRDLAINYVGAIINAPDINSEDYLPFRLAIAELGGGLFSALRTRLNLSYDPGAQYMLLKMPFAKMNLSTPKPKEAIAEMIQQINIVKNKSIDGDYLDIIKNSFIVTKYLKEESSSAITQNLGLSEILGGWQFAERLPELLENISGNDIKKAFNKYVVGSRWVYLGN